VPIGSPSIPGSAERLPDASQSPNDDLASPPVAPPRRETMRYLCLVYYDEKKLDALSTSEYDALVAEALAYREVLRKSGHYIISDGLQSVRTATTVRIQGGKVSVTDGPFAETKEQLGGFMLIEARDLNDAVRVASQIPPVRLGCIEVRPLRELAALAEDARRP
jgi:hypothetical protein